MRTIKSSHFSHNSSEACCVLSCDHPNSAELFYHGLITITVKLQHRTIHGTMEFVHTNLYFVYTHVNYEWCAYPINILKQYPSRDEIKIRYKLNKLIKYSSVFSVKILFSPGYVARRQAVKMRCDVRT